MLSEKLSYILLIVVTIACAVFANFVYFGTIGYESQISKIAYSDDLKQGVTIKQTTEGISFTADFVSVSNNVFLTRIRRKDNLQRIIVYSVGGQSPGKFYAYRLKGTIKNLDVGENILQIYETANKRLILEKRYQIQ